jgi:hypothetical protein
MSDPAVVARLEQQAATILSLAQSLQLKVAADEQEMVSLRRSIQSMRDEAARARVKVSALRSLFGLPGGTGEVEGFFFTQLLLKESPWRLQTSQVL